MSASNLRDEFSENLLKTDFDPVQYLNESLPSLNLTSHSGAKQNRTTQLQSCSSDLQANAAKASAYSARVSSELSTLTDEILRSGHRLSYEVEVLRSDANSLFDLLSETLRADIELFVREEVLGNSFAEGQTLDREHATQTDMQISQDPEFMQQLRVLGRVKARLEEVIRVFGEAMKWPIPPSDVSVASSLISVSAPELGVANTAEDDKARATIRRIREEISDLLNSEGGGSTGVDTAQRRVEHFQNLGTVWQGTAEERARNRVLDGFSKLVEDRRKALASQNQYRRGQVDSGRSSAHGSRSGTPNIPAGGLLGGLRKLRDEIYLD